MVKYIFKSKVPTIQRYDLNTEIKREAHMRMKVQQEFSRSYLLALMGTGINHSHQAPSLR